MSDALDRLRPLTPYLAKALSFAPSVCKYIAVALVVLNIGSFPLFWHARVFRSVILLRIQWRFFLIRNMFKSRKRRDELEAQWLDNLTPIGEDPFAMCVPYDTRARIDDSDFNLHLSNSSYAKTLDSARFKAAMEAWPNFFVAGGWMPLAATHYHFIREIPMLSHYQVRIRIGAWDQKWMYCVCRFVTIPKKGAKKRVEKPPSPAPETDPNPANISMHIISTPADDFASSAPTPNPNTTSPPESTEKMLKAVTAGLSFEEEDGAIVHTVSVSQMCYKIGRITVPPALVFATNGFSQPAPEGAAPYSRTNPPPHWATVQDLGAKPKGGSVRKMRDFLKGGWKGVPESERWWEQALGGPVEERRKAALPAFQKIVGGMDAVRGLH
ncbi:hypothetical protein BD626DRAFT_392602 [Schizophyllum amplum]|uniref:Thioesterase-like superfamily-domain-containing protein n=1 Tax=Schizophyllum amplum TaxID=97359 RepID=A0A550CYW0_9AGAR|nr:hypothetical protein BD626DRAFT_392602 [Auriculariopsis ampla]